MVTVRNLAKAYGIPVDEFRKVISEEDQLNVKPTNNNSPLSDEQVKKIVAWFGKEPKKIIQSITGGCEVDEDYSADEDTRSKYERDEQAEELNALADEKIKSEQKNASSRADCSGLNAPQVDITREYFRDMNNYPLLEESQVTELFKTMQTGSESEKKAARTKLINSNLRLIIKPAKQAAEHNPAIDFMDFVQAGNTGLMKAIDAFDYTKGFKLSTYAFLIIRQEINRLSDNSTNISIPGPIKKQIKAIINLSKVLTQIYGRKPTTTEISEYTTKYALSREKINALLQKRYQQPDDLTSDELQQLIEIDKIISLYTEIFKNDHPMDELSQKKFLCSETLNTGNEHQPEVINDIAAIYAGNSKNCGMISTIMTGRHLSPEEVEELMLLNQGTRSTEEDLVNGNDDSITLGDTISDPDNSKFDPNSLSELEQLLVKVLTPLETKVIKAYVFYSNQMKKKKKKKKKEKKEKGLLECLDKKSIINNIKAEINAPDYETAEHILDSAFVRLRTSNVMPALKEKYHLSL